MEEHLETVMNTIREHVDVDTVQKEALRLYDTYGQDKETISYAMFAVHAILMAVFTSRRYAAAGKRNPPLLSGFVVMLVSGLGGALVSSLLNAESPFFLANDFYIGCMLAAWLLINLPIINLVYYVIVFPPVMAVLLASEGIFVGQIICTAVEGAMSRYHGTILVPIVLGTITGCSGVVVGQAFFRGLENEKGQTALASASMSIVGPLFAATIHTITFMYGNHKLEIPPVGHNFIDNLDLEVRHLVMLWFVFYFEFGLVLDTLSWLFGGSDKPLAEPTTAQKPAQTIEEETTVVQKKPVAPSPGGKKTSKKGDRKSVV